MVEAEVWFHLRNLAGGGILRASHAGRDWDGARVHRGDPFLQEGASPAPSTKNSHHAGPLPPSAAGGRGLEPDEISAGRSENIDLKGGTGGPHPPSNVACAAELPPDGPAILREVPFEIEKDGFIVTGAIDRIAKTADGAWAIWDYKTTGLSGRSRSEIVRQEAYDVQLRFYAWAASLVLSSGIESAAVVFTGAREDPLFPVSVDPQSVRETVEGLLGKMAELAEKSVVSYEAAGSQWYCRTCPCPELELCSGEVRVRRGDPFLQEGASPAPSTKNS